MRLAAGLMAFIFLLTAGLFTRALVSADEPRPAPIADPASTADVPEFLLTAGR
jgi:hypothetical protein